MRIRDLVCAGAALWCVAATADAAAVRVCSVYLESYAAFQKQMAQGAALFEAPQLAGLPMMMTVSMPGFALVDTSKPIALHVVSTAPGKTGVVLELSAANGAEAYVQALAGNGTPLPAPVDGIYRLANGMSVRTADSKAFVVLKGDDPAACLAGEGLFPPLPSVGGAVRVSVAPAALGPMLAEFKQSSAKTPAGAAAPGVRSLEATCDFYGLLLEQIESLELGLELQEGGLRLNTLFAPRPGSDVAAVVASAKPVAASELAFVDGGSAISFASGPYAVPERLKRAFLDFYLKMAASAPAGAAVSTNDLAAVMSRSFDSFGAAAGITARIDSPAAGVRAEGTLRLANPKAYIDAQMAMMTSSCYRATLRQSGVVMQAPSTRQAQGLTIYGWKSAFDEQTLQQAMRAAMPSNVTPEQAEAAVRANAGMAGSLMKLFGSGYEWAATSDRMLFGVGEPAMIERALARTRAPVATVEVVRIRRELAPSTVPCALGRVSIAAVLRAFAPEAPAAAAGGDAKGGAEADGAILFAQWVEQGRSRSVAVVSPSEIKAIVRQVQSLQAKARQPPAPPLPGGSADGSGGGAQP